CAAERRWPPGASTSVSGGGWWRAGWGRISATTTSFSPTPSRPSTTAFGTGPGGWRRTPPRAGAGAGPAGGAGAGGGGGARDVGGSRWGGRALDRQVDYLQLCHRAEALRAFPGDEYWPEDKATEDHADGIFLERLGARFPIVPVDVKICQNRRTGR